MAVTLTINQFRADFVEFANATKYPDAQLTFWLTLGSLLINASRWGEVVNYGVELYMAHNLALAAMAQKQGARGIPGAASGMLNSKSVDKVSAGYDTASVAEEFGGNWNLTTYGQRLYRLMKQFGAGPLQIGAGPGAAPVYGSFPGPGGLNGGWWW
jgi:hypothetical protein